MGPDMSEECDHEEADTKIVIHVLHALREEEKNCSSADCGFLFSCNFDSSLQSV